jgi:hypothetical protein
MRIREQCPHTLPGRSGGVGVMVGIINTIEFGGINLQQTVREGGNTSRSGRTVAYRDNEKAREQKATYTAFGRGGGRWGPLWYGLREERRRGQSCWE